MLFTAVPLSVRPTINPSCAFVFGNGFGSQGVDLVSMAQATDKFQEQMDSMARRMVSLEQW